MHFKFNILSQWDANEITSLTEIQNLFLSGKGILDHDGLTRSLTSFTLLISCLHLDFVANEWASVVNRIISYTESYLCDIQHCQKHHKTALQSSFRPSRKIKEEEVFIFSKNLWNFYIIPWSWSTDHILWLIYCRSIKTKARMACVLQIALLNDAVPMRVQKFD